jgi:Domain of unknown function (DUF5076)
VVARQKSCPDTKQTPRTGTSPDIAQEKGKIMAQSDQLRVPEPARTDAKSFELLRVWIAHQDQHISMRVGVWKEPEAWGMMLADLARHIAAAFEQAEKRDPMEMLARIKAGFETEIESPTEEVQGELAG